MRTHTRLLALTAIILAAACGDSNGPGPSAVALFARPNFVDYDTTDFYATASQAEFTFASLGAPVTTFTGIDSAAFAAVLGANGLLFLPVSAGYDLGDSLPAASKTLLRDFVDSSGGVLVVAGDGMGLAMLDTLWGFTIISASNQNYYSLGAGAAGTGFAGGSALVWDNETMYTVDGTSLPVGAKVIYANGSDVAFALIPHGRGTVVICGWDLAAGVPHGPQDGGWIDVLRRMLRL